MKMSEACAPLAENFGRFSRELEMDDISVSFSDICSNAREKPSGNAIIVEVPL